MSDEHTLKVIARIRSDFPEKFGIPRQSGLVEALKARVVFEPAYRRAEALRGLEGFSHIWLIWQFSENLRPGWSPLVRPPRLGGNRRLGVFATRSPFRPNPLGLSAVRLEGIELTEDLGPVLRVSGADLMDGTPIYDVKPYLPYADAIPEALGGFAGETARPAPAVDFPPALLARVPAEKRDALLGILAQDPRPGYQTGETREYGLAFGGVNVRFTARGERLAVTAVEPVSGKDGPARRDR